MALLIEISLSKSKFRGDRGKEIRCLRSRTCHGSKSPCQLNHKVLANV